MKKIKWMALVSLSALLVGSAVAWGDYGQDSSVYQKTTTTGDVGNCTSQYRTSSTGNPPEKLDYSSETGRFVDHDQAVAMGGVGNYVSPGEAKRYDQKLAETESLRRQVASSEKQLPPVAEASPDQGVVFFQVNQAKLTPDGKAEIASLSKELKQDPNLAIEVNGYTDSTGTQNLNQTLSAERADTVKSELLSHGVSPEQISTYAFGEDEPIASNDTQEGRAVNRRAEVYVENATESSYG